MSRPYVFINDRLQTYFTLKARLDGNAKFDTLNAHLRNIVVVPGQLVIMGDLSIRTLCSEEIELMSYAQGVQHQLRDSLADGEGEVLRNYDLLQNMLSYGSLGIGAATGSWIAHLDGVKKTLEDIERLYKLSLQRGTPIARQQFINQRRVLFAKLSNQLKGLARWGTGMHGGGSIKKMLGISTKSYLHTPELRRYTQRLTHIAKISRLLKAGTPVGIGLNGMSTYLQIQEACSMGREEVCTRARFVEGAKLVGSVGGGYAGGVAGSAVSTSACFVVLGALSGPGALACTIVGAVAGGYSGGVLGEMGGEAIGIKLYEWRPDSVH